MSSLEKVDELALNACLCGSFRRVASFVEHLQNNIKSFVKLQKKKIK